MDISPACSPPIQPHISDADRSHLFFAEYMRYRSSMSRLLVEADSFSDWLYQHQSQKIRDNATKHQRYPEFLGWMRHTQGGAKTCPAGNFPSNFQFWLDGGRW
jgi:hypothetical protein